MLVGPVKTVIWSVVLAFTALCVTSQTGCDGWLPKAY